MTIWRMRISCWVPKATNTHTLRLCNTHCFSTATMAARADSMLRYKYIAYLVCFNCETEVEFFPGGCTFFSCKAFHTLTRAFVWKAPNNVSCTNQNT
jgi:hypothetical protein